MGSSAFGNWPLVTLGSLTSKIRSGATPKGGQAAYLPTRDHFVLVRSQNVFDHNFDTTGLANISDVQAAGLHGAELQPSDVLLNITGDGVTFGRACLIPENVLPACVNQHVVLIRANETELHAGYLAAWLALPETKSYIESFNAGGSRRAITKGHIESFRLPLPPLHVQNEIGELAASLNSRVDVLRQTNTTLEAIAQTLFKSWFVDFDPAHAKAEGREPEAMHAATAALFPSELEESEQGLTPKGWKQSTLGDMCTSRGGSIQTGPFGSQLHASDYLPTGIPVAMPQDLLGRRIREDKIARVDPSDAARLSRHKLKNGDIVFSRRGDVGRHAVISEREVGWLCGTGCLLVRPGDSESISTFMSAALARPEALEWLVRHAIGATMPNLNTKILSKLPMVSPPAELIAEFERVVSPLERRVTANHAQAESLSSIRDTLLPRLISGKLRLPQIEEALVEV